MDMYISYSKDRSTISPPPTLRVSCSQQDPWKSLWGPEITCTSDPSNTQFINVGTTNKLVPSRLVGPFSDTFKCSISSKHIYKYDVEYQCQSPHSTFAANSISFASNCVYNTSIWLGNVLSPVAELDLQLPSPRQAIGTAEFRCDELRQVLNCPELTLNASFYENTFEPHWLADPIKCYLSYSFTPSDDPGAINDEASLIIDSAPIATTVLHDISNLTASAMEMSANGIAAGVGYEWFFLFVLVFIVAGAVGNLLVCFAVLLDRKLQNVTNYFLFSLAIADLLVSLVVMPLGAIPSFIGHWPLSLAWCNVYVTCDVLACSSSILHMCFISVGRYMGIRNPLGSRHKSTKRLTFLKITVVWLLAMMVCSSITVLGLINTQNIMPHEQMCTINNRAFFVFGSLVTFYIPMIIMVTTFALTVRLLGKKAKFAHSHPDSDKWRRISTIKSSPNPCATTTSASMKSHQDGFRSFSRYNPKRPTLTIDQSTQTPHSISSDTKRYKLKSLNFQFRNVSRPSINLNIRFLNNRSKRRGLSANAVATEQKATKVLGVVFFTFVLFWSPFFILNIVFAICPMCDISSTVVDVCLWLGYVSSTINPIIYTIFNKTFRAAFIRLLRCDCSKRSHLLRYQSVNERSGGGATNSICTTPTLLPVAISMQGSSPLAQPTFTHTSTLDDFRGSYTITDDEC